MAKFFRVSPLTSSVVSYTNFVDPSPVCAVSPDACSARRVTAYLHLNAKTSDDFHRDNFLSGTGVAFAPPGRVAFAAHTQEEAMFYVVSLLNRFRRDEDGQDLLEYALLVALIAIVAVAAVTAAGLKVDTIFKTIVSKLP